MDEGLPQGFRGLGMGVAAGRLGRRRAKIGDRLLGVARLREVVGQAVVDVLQMIGVERLESQAGGQVQGLAAAGQQALVDRLLRQGVLEEVHGGSSAVGAS